MAASLWDSQDLSPAHWVFGISNNLECMVYLGWGERKGQRLSNGAAFNFERVIDALKKVMKTLALLFQTKKKKKKVHIQLPNSEYSLMGAPDPLKPICATPLGWMDPRLKTLFCVWVSAPNHPRDGPFSS